MKKIVSLIILVLGLLVLAGCGGGQSDSGKKAEQGQEPIKIGVVLDITGHASSLGVPERDSVELIKDELKAKGGTINGRPVEIIILDNGSDETKAVLAAKKLVEQEKVVALIGSSTSGPSMAMINIAQQAQIPMISPAASIKIIEPSKDRKWIFKTAQNDAVVAVKMIEYLKSKGITKVAFLHMNNTFGESGKVEFEKVAKTSGVEVVALEKYEPTDKDMTSQLTRIKSASPQAVVVWAIPPTASIVAKNFKQLGLQVPLIQSHGVGNQTFIDLAEDAANGVIFPIGKLLVAEGLPDSDPQKQVLVKYAKDYEAKYGPRSTFGGHGWDAVQIVLQAIEKVGAEPAKIRDELEKTQGFAGISGVFNMSPTDHSGLDKDDLVMVEIVNGKWQLVK
ncbi:MAG: ABC transporter substrate-binding protein [Thermincolia bacterium]